MDIMQIGRCFMADDMGFSRNVIRPVLGCCVFVMAGCGQNLIGDLTTGANYKAKVVYKPSTTAAPAEDSSDAEVPSNEVASGGTGLLRGKVEFSGQYTPLPPLYVKGGQVKDAAVCAAAEAADESILVKDFGLANVFVYLKKAPKVSGDVVSDANVIFDQKNCVFLPHAMTVRVGQTIKVLNSDAVAHNTHTNGKKTTSFNSIVNPNDTVGATLVYKQAEQEPISVVCDIHPWMRAYHLPIDHPFVALSAADGSFEIKDLPVGKHEFKVWHEVGGLLEKNLVVDVKPGENQLTIKVSNSQLKK